MEIATPSQDTFFVWSTILGSAYFAIFITGMIASLFGWRLPSGVSNFFWFIPAPPLWFTALFLLFAIPFIGMIVGIFWYGALADMFGSTEYRALSLLVYIAVLCIAWLIVFFKTIAMTIEAVREDPGVYVRGVIAIVVILGAYAVTDYLFDIPVIDLIDPSKEAVQ